MIFQKVIHGDHSDLINLLDKLDYKKIQNYYKQGFGSKLFLLEITLVVTNKSERP